MTKPAGQDNCPCLSGELYGECCGKFHSGAAEAATAEQLMRSRYSAFAQWDADYLLRTWHPDKAPPMLQPDPETVWRRLDILSTSGGGPFDKTGTVEFKAHYRHGGERGILHEVSRFVRENGRWYYMDGDVLS